MYSSEILSIAKTVAGPRDEAAGLHGEDLDLDQGVIYVRRSVWRGGKHRLGLRRAFQSTSKAFSFAATTACWEASSVPRCRARLEQWTVASLWRRKADGTLRLMS
jgi:hypothetical protein